MYRIEPTHDSLHAKMSRLRYAGFGFCLRCGMPWKLVEGHTTRYTNRSGCFPLCKTCWVLLEAPEARIEYYGKLVELWASDGHPISKDTENDIKLAVANGG